MSVAPTVPLHSELPPPLLLTKKRRWTIKHALSTRHNTESHHDASFFTHSKHVLVCSWSGRPVYSRYGDDSKLSSYMGVITALIENYKRINANQSMTSIKAGPYTIIFKIYGPLYFIVASRTGEGRECLLQQLEYSYLQILSVLTGQVSTILTQRPQFDVRNLMTGTENLLSDLLVEYDRNYDSLLTAYHLLPLPYKLRLKIRQALKKAAKHCIYAILLAQTHVIDIVNCQPKINKFYPQDLNILINFLHNSQSLQSSEAWTPLCLPKFNNTGYVYVYVGYLTEIISLCLVTVNSTGFENIRQCKNEVVDTLIKKHCMEEILMHAYDNQQQSSNTNASTNQFGSSNSFGSNGSSTLSLSSSLTLGASDSGTLTRSDSDLTFVAGVSYSGYNTDNQFIDLADIDELTSLSDILHFIYRHDASQQSLQSTFLPPFHTTKQRRQLFRIYQKVLERAGLIQYDTISGAGTGTNRRGEVLVVWSVASVCNVLLLNRPGDCVIVCAFLTGTEKSAALNTANRILKWIKREENNLIFVG